MKRLFLILIMATSRYACADNPLAEITKVLKGAADQVLDIGTLGELGRQRDKLRAEEKKKQARAKLAQAESTKRLERAHLEYSINLLRQLSGLGNRHLDLLTKVNILLLQQTESIQKLAEEYKTQKVKNQTLLSVMHQQFNDLSDLASTLNWSENSSLTLIQNKLKDYLFELDHLPQVLGEIENQSHIENLIGSATELTQLLKSEIVSTEERNRIQGDSLKSAELALSELMK